MPTWGQILTELQAEQELTKQLPFDSVRRKYLAVLYQRTGRPISSMQRSGHKRVLWVWIPQ